MNTIGHNVLTENERKAIFGRHARLLRANRAEQRRLKDIEKDFLADAKNDQINITELKMFLKVDEDEDKQKHVQKHNLERSALVKLGLLKEALQGDLLADRATREQLIFTQGQTVGLMAGDRVSGYSAGHTDDKTWLSGYDDGQRIMRDELESAMSKLKEIRGDDDTDIDSEAFRSMA
jgi:hypothetical protein